LFLYRPGYTAMDAAGVFGWVLSLATGSVLLTWLFRRTRGSVLVCALLHATMDAAFTSAAADGPVMAYVGAGVTVWGAWVLFYRRALSRPYNALIFCGILFALISGHD
jgi:membrane protease YdiL (CAAX protease family)